jgi:hypothetical protein
MLRRHAHSRERRDTHLGMRRAALFVLVMLTLLLASKESWAESALVVLVRPSTQSAVVTEAITRIRGELIADGFEVSVVDAPPGSDPASVLARADQQTGAAATLGLFLHPDASAAELWVVDRLTSKTVVRSVEMSKSPGVSVPEVLARRSVELLRASLLEILVDAQKRPFARSAPRAQTSRWVARALEPRRSSWGVEAGAQVLAGFGGVGGAVIPIARVRTVLGERIGARLTVSGLGTSPRVDAAEGTATVRQELGLLELIGEIAPQSWLRPSVSIGAGAYHISVEGSANWPYAGLSGGRFAFAADAGVGLALSFTSAFALALEGHALLVTPYPVIRFLDVDAAETGRPLLSGALTLVGWL